MMSWFQWVIILKISGKLSLIWKMFRSGCNLTKINKERFKQSMMILSLLITIQKISDKLKRIKMLVNGQILRTKSSFKWRIPMWSDKEKLFKLQTSNKNQMKMRLILKMTAHQINRKLILKTLKKMKKSKVQ